MSTDEHGFLAPEGRGDRKRSWWRCIREGLRRDPGQSVRGFVSSELELVEQGELKQRHGWASLRCEASQAAGGVAAEVGVGALKARHERGNGFGWRQSELTERVGCLPGNELILIFEAFNEHRDGRQRVCTESRQVRHWEVAGPASGIRNYGHQWREYVWACAAQYTGQDNRAPLSSCHRSGCHGQTRELAGGGPCLEPHHIEGGLCGVSAVFAGSGQGRPDESWKFVQQRQELLPRLGGFVTDASKQRRNGVRADPADGPLRFDRDLAVPRVSREGIEPIRQGTALVPRFGVASEQRHQGYCREQASTEEEKLDPLPHGGSVP
jgi:hypothetical protein